MQISVTEAARRVGRSKATLLRSIKAGTISATRDEATGAFRIDVAELHRIFPAVPDAADAHHETGHDASRANLLAQLAGTEARIAEMQEAARLRDDTIADLRRRLDAEAEERRKLTALLTNQRLKEAHTEPTTVWGRFLAWRRVR